jgi:hypothetical protein
MRLLVNTKHRRSNVANPDQVWSGTFWPGRIWVLNDSSGSIFGSFFDIGNVILAREVKFIAGYIGTYCLIKNIENLFLHIAAVLSYSQIFPESDPVQITPDAQRGKEGRRLGGTCMPLRMYMLLRAAVPACR